MSKYAEAPGPSLSRCRWDDIALIPVDGPLIGRVMMCPHCDLSCEGMPKSCANCAKLRGRMDTRPLEGG